MTVALDYRGRRIEARLSAASSAFVLPLNGRARLRDPWGTLPELLVRKPIADLGWDLWDGRPAAVYAAASGSVLTVRAEPSHGPIIEIDHGSGLRSRYVLNRYGTATVTPGTRVSAGDKIGELGRGEPDDIPYLHFGVLLDVGGGELVALDPAPFVFGITSNRALPFTAGLLNAAVRARDRSELARLLGLGIDPKGRAVDDTLPLEWAIMLRDVQSVRSLIVAGGDPEAATARFGYMIEGLGMTIAHSGPTIAELARESDDSELVAALTK